MVDLEELTMRVNPFASNSQEYADMRSQNIAPVESKIDNNISLAFGLFKKLYCGEYGYMSGPLMANSVPVLDPSQIDILLQLVKHHIRQPAEPWDETTGRYLSSLVMRSKISGYNNFILNTGDTLIRSLPYDWQQHGNPDMIYRINGVSNGPYMISNCVGTHHGDVKGPAAMHLCSNSKFYLHGDVDIESCLGAFRCRFEFYGRVGDGFGKNSDSCTYIFHTKDIGGLGAIHENNMFIAYDEDVFDILAKKVGEYRSPNMRGPRLQLQLIGKDNKVIKEVTACQD